MYTAQTLSNYFFHPSAARKNFDGAQGLTNWRDNAESFRNLMFITKIFLLIFTFTGASPPVTPEALLMLSVSHYRNTRNT